jgi:protein disulfide-isomerase
MIKDTKMKVDIWSDIRCPFCYIGKRKFEAALDRFGHKNKVEVVWHSFELDPSLKNDLNLDAYDYLAQLKGQPREWSISAHRHVAQAAKEVGLDYDFDNAIVANSFDAHRLIQLAKTKDLADAAEEALFRAHFTDGKNIGDTDTLIEIGSQIGLEASNVQKMLASNAFTEEVRADHEKAVTLGIRGVPFFLVNDHFGVSGAQSPEMFLRALQQGWAEFEEAQLITVETNYEAAVCSVDGNCN